MFFTENHNVQCAKMKFRRHYIHLLLVMAICLWESTAYGQSPLQNKALFDKAYELVNSNPDEALKIGQYLLKNNQSEVQKTASYLLMAEGYWAKGDYNNAVINVFEADKYSDSAEEDEKIKILIFKAQLFKTLYLDNQAKRCLEEASRNTLNLKSADAKDFFKAKILVCNSTMYLDRQNPQKAIELLDKVGKDYKSALDKNISLQQDFFISKGKTYIGLTEADSANYYLKKAQQLPKETSSNLLNKITILNGMSFVYFQQKQHARAIDTLLESMKMAKKLKNEALLKSINRQLSINYLALNNKTNHQLFDNEFLKLHNRVELMEQEAVNSAYNLISQEQEADFQKAKKRHADYFYITIGIFIFVVIAGSLLWLKGSMKKKRLKEIISYLEISRNNSVKLHPEKKETNKKIAIPVETEQIILAKLKRFENSVRFTNKEMSLAVLAGQFDTNTKYLSEIINKHYQDNFNTYINKLRINFIIEKLKDDPNYMHYKISYLAEKSGFSSHSSFATVFKSITGIAPGTFIELLKDETEAKKQEKIDSHA